MYIFDICLYIAYIFLLWYGETKNTFCRPDTGMRGRAIRRSMKKKWAYLFILNLKDVSLGLLFQQHFKGGPNQGFNYQQNMDVLN